MSCPSCISGSLNDGKYLCSTNDYRVVDSNNDLVFTIESHDISSGDEEINSYTDIKYCVCKYWYSE